MRNILFLPRWYPDETDPQNAVFIQKHAQAVALKHRVTVLYLAPQIEGKLFSKSIQTEGNLKEIRIFYRSFAKIPGGRALNMLLYGWKGFWEIRKIIKKERPNLVHVHMLNRPGLLAMIVKRIWRIPYLVTEHWTGYLDRKYDVQANWKKKLTRRIIKNAELVTVVSLSLRNAMLDKGLKNRYEIVPNVVESKPVPEGPPPVNPNRVNILSVSDLYDQKKNITGLIRVFFQIAADHPTVDLHIIGGGPDSLAIKKLVHDNLFFKNRVFLHGRLPNEKVLAYMQQIDFYICFSNVETFSVATAEALAAGKPVICTACGGPELFVNEENGLVIPVGDENALFVAMLRMIKDYRHYHPQKQKDYAEGLFNIRAVGKQFNKIYLEILNQTLS